MAKMAGKAFKAAALHNKNRRQEDHDHEDEDLVQL